MKEDNPLFSDVLIVGAGFAGVYMLYRLRERGFSAEIIETGSGVGGTWYWNRYPGARCDVDNMFYSYSFDEKLDMEWNWSERYPTQTEILKYANHVVERYELGAHIHLNSRVISARYLDDGPYWFLQVEDGRQFSSQFVVMATGCLSAANLPAFPGTETFSGRLYHTGHWPKEKIDFTGRRVGVVGTGSSGVQVIQEVAKVAQKLTVFQRTASYVVEAFNHRLTDEIGLL